MPTNSSRMKKKSKPPTAWAKAYPNSDFHTINPSNYLEWLKAEERY